MWKAEQGQALVLVAICLAILLGFMGLAIDIGLIYQTRQNVQPAADAAATAAALDFLYNRSPSSAQAAGKAAAAINGFTDGTDGVQVAMHVPPESGPMAGAMGYAEALITDPTPTSFLRLFGYPTMTVAARAVAGNGNVADACIWLMDPDGTGLALQGSADIEAPKCGIYINSKSSQAITVTGGAGIVNARFVDVVGNPSPAHELSPTPVSTNSTRRTPPYADVQGPNPDTDCGITLTTDITSSNVSSLSGHSVVCFSKKVTLTDVILPGAESGVVYVFEKGVALSGTVTFGSGNYDPNSGIFTTTAGAVMDIYGGSLDQNNAVLNVFAPTFGTYNGIGILQPADNPNLLQIQFGSSNRSWMAISSRSEPRFIYRIPAAEAQRRQVLSPSRSSTRTRRFISAIMTRPIG